MKQTVLLGILAATAQVVVAAPPACLLAAVNTQSNPSDLNAVCSSSNATDVKQYINKHCSNNVDAAMSAFSSVCNNAGQTTSASATGTAASSTSSPGAATRDGVDGKGAALAGILGALLAL